MGWSTDEATAGLGIIQEKLLDSLLLFRMILKPFGAEPRSETSSAERWMKKAEAVAGEEAEKARYHHKLELLMGEDSGG